MSTKADRVLKPCPFCGCTTPEIRSNGIGDYYVICDGDDEDVSYCGASTSDVRCESEEHAAERWNNQILAHKVKAMDAVVEAAKSVVKIWGSNEVSMQAEAAAQDLIAAVEDLEGGSDG